MREIVVVQAGQCGVQLGTSFWSSMCVEHGIDVDTGRFNGLHDAQLQNLETFFTEGNAGRRVPRSVLVDLEPGPLESVQAGKLGRLFRPDNFMFGQAGAGNNWGKGHYTEGAELADGILDVLRKEAEDCDCLQGFQMMHSMGGGTGSGLGTLLMNKIREEYPDRMMCTFSVFPSPKVSSTVVEPYNTVLASNQLIENADQVVVLENASLFRICEQTLGLSTVTFDDVNRTAAAAMMGVTSSLRFPGQLNSDLRKLSVNLVPFPRLHFFSTSYAPLFSRASAATRLDGVPNIVSQLFASETCMSGADPLYGRYLAAAALFRGKVATSVVEKCLQREVLKRSSHYVDYIPNNIKSSICNVPAADVDVSAALLGNSTSIQSVFQLQLERFGLMFRRKAFLNWYTGEGMDEMEFTEAHANVGDLVSEYQQYQDATADDDEDDEDDYEEEEEADEFSSFVAQPLQA